MFAVIPTTEATTGNDMTATTKALVTDDSTSSLATTHCELLYHFRIFNHIITVIILMMQTKVQIVTTA